MHLSSAIALAVTTTLLAGGCSALAEDDDLTVAAGFYPLAWVSEQVAGDRAEVVNLTRPGQEAHDSGLSIARTADLAGADLVVLSGGFQAEVDAAAQENAGGAVLDVTDVVELRPATTHDHSEEGADEHGHEEHGDLDPHFWLDPLLMADLGDAVAAELGRVDPEGTDAYESAAESLRARLTALDQDYTQGLGSCERHTVVVSHDAFGYLGRYGLEFEPIAGLSPDAEPTPADLQHLQELIEQEQLTTVFSETLTSPRLAETLAEDLGVVTDVLDPLEGLGDTDSDDDYLSLMQDNLAALQQANGC